MRGSFVLDFALNHSEYTVLDHEPYEQSDLSKVLCANVLVLTGLVELPDEFILHVQIVKASAVYLRRD